MSSSERKSEVLKKIAPGVDEEPLCEKKSHRKRACVKTEQKRKEKWVELLLCRYDTPRLSSDAKNYLSGILGKNGGNAATSSYHGDDDDDHDDDDLDYDGGDESYDEEDDYSVVEAAAVRIRPV